MATGIARYPYLVPVDAYGNGGFRFAGMSHRGSILCLPSGICAWLFSGAAVELGIEDFAAVFAERHSIDMLLLGTGRQQEFPSLEVRAAFADAAIGLDVMDTGAAARTFNVLLSEGRRVGAALIAVD